MPDINLNDIKKRTRSGMGYCQGANCQPAIAAILAREFDADPAKIKMLNTRPPARPIPLNLLMVDLEEGMEFGIRKSEFGIVFNGRMRLSFNS